LVSLAKCGLTVEAENPVALAKGIIELYQMSPQERYILGQNGKEYVLKYHNYQILTEKLLSLIDSVE
jgi:spore maturation protein CgeB